MRVVAEMRNATEYQDKQLSRTETVAVKSSWDAIREWAEKQNIGFKP